MTLMNGAALSAVAKRQLMSFLGNPLGYLFMLAFVVASGAILYWPDDYFTRNIADLDPLVTWMPWLLSVLVPALAMGSWATERERGTEELLLTMPVGIVDAVVGKFLAIAGFFTLALVFNLANVICLVWLGSPDLGQIAAQFFGWWILGLGAVALSLLGSILVSNQAIAFLLGGLFSASFTALAQVGGLLAPFERGVIHFGAALIALVVICLALAVAMTLLSARRWRPGYFDSMGIQLLNLGLALFIAVNCTFLAYRGHLDRDISSDGVASLLPEAERILEELPTIPGGIHITVVVTQDDLLPKRPYDMRVKAEELIRRAQAIKRTAPESVTLEILRPTDALDEAGTKATTELALESRPMQSETVVGSEMVDVFLGAVVRAGDKSITIPFLDHGLPAEYELVRAVQSVARQANRGDRPEVDVVVTVSATVPGALTEKYLEVLEKYADLGKRASDPRSKLNVRLETIVDNNGSEAKAAEERGIQRYDARVGALTEADGATPPPESTVFMGAVARSGEFTRTASWLGDEYEPGDTIDDLVAGVRALAEKPQPVVGILSTDLRISGGGFNQATMSPNPSAAIVEEWRKQYDVRTVAANELGEESTQNIDVLVAPLPSSLTEPQMRRLHDWIFEGNPTLLLVDSFPQLAPGRLAPAEPKAPPFPGAREVPEKGNLNTIIQGMGLVANMNEIGWSSYRPDPSLRQLPHYYSWHQKQDGAILEHPITAGIDTVLAVFPTFFERAINAKTTITPLITPSPNAPWGRNTYQKLVQRSPMQPAPPFTPARQGTEAFYAVHAEGTMHHGYETGDDDLPLLSGNDIQVVVVGDTDLAADQIFNFYRDIGGSVSSNEGWKFFSKVRNIQFLSNAVDVLAGEGNMTALRTRLPQVRPLDKIANVVVETDAMVQEVITSSLKELEEKQEEAKDILDNRLQDLERQSSDMDARTRLEEVEIVRNAAQSQYEKSLLKIQRTADQRIAEVKRSQRERIQIAINQVRWMVMAIPALILGLLVLGVWVGKAIRERTDIPASRDRRKQ